LVTEYNGDTPTESLTLDDIIKITGISFNKAKSRLKILENEGKIKSYFFDDNIFYMKS